jgi:hypothetical protein
METSRRQTVPEAFRFNNIRPLLAGDRIREARQLLKNLESQHAAVKLLAALPGSYLPIYFIRRDLGRRPGLRRTPSPAPAGRLALSPSRSPRGLLELCLDAMRGPWRCARIREAPPASTGLLRFHAEPGDGRGTVTKLVLNAPATRVALSPVAKLQPRERKKGSLGAVRGHALMAIARGQCRE